MANLRVIIFNVELGLCGFIKSPTGKTLLIDCGQTANFSPTKYLVENELIDTADEGEYTFSKFILSHPHGDHIDDIDRLKVYKPKIICRQKEYDWDAVKEVNTESGAEKVDIYKEWQATYNLPATDPDWGFDLYRKDYLTPKQAEELEKSKMLNNSSIPVIITFAGAKYIQKFLFPGDLEQKGWLELLKRKTFKEAIKSTTFFITSHHGHTSVIARRFLMRWESHCLISSQHIPEMKALKQLTQTRKMQSESISTVIFDICYQPGKIITFALTLSRADMLG